MLTPTPSDACRHFLDLGPLDPATLRSLLDLARAIKADPGAHTARLRGQTLILIFEKPSTRTRVSFEVAMRGLGGDVVVLNAGDMQLGRGETVADTARVLSRYGNALMLRTDCAAKLAQLAAHASVPVINGLTDRSHPCQIMADILTFEEHRGPIAGRVVAWCGDGNNVAESFLEAAARFHFSLRLACPEGFAPPAERIAWAQAEGADVTLLTDPQTAVAGADLVVTDTWLSMNQPDSEAALRRRIFAPFQVNSALMAAAAPQALFMHCLPAHRGEEVTDAVMDGPQSVVWDEAENRLHAQRAILCWCLER